ncbi:hypothetical protein [Legionella jordanis]|uniref:Uncharacterized protein n=1 Tax=Legionella jordanis TaxID=456 RepID=A0A0W0VC48_9GAMM|nr:hypothetical protein [Legionella jordanis]HCJ4232870.1 hypothetical protein [Legionella pneumophila]KTD17707.1 hypothetical protein Ljor_2013 [Legionella jordanis]RMX01575.1 hypothetical protein EAW55_10795 [Legionella jordanis]RMX21571.1 hypothetical protein EAS68_02080 [Legionella jordanis]VEH11361.1 Uncharacterised protein [Legionella jordanis]
MDLKTQNIVHIVMAVTLLFSNITHAKRMFMLGNVTPHLKILNKPAPEMSAVGPTDFVVFNGLIAVLDSDNHAISFFNYRGNYIKRIELPSGYYQRLIKDRDGVLFAFANNGLTTRIVKISNKQFEQKELDINFDSLISRAVIDDFGLYFESVSPLNLNTLSELSNCPSCLLKKEKSRLSQSKKQRIARSCLICEPQEVDGPLVKGQDYQIVYEGVNGQKPSLIIGEQKIKLNHAAMNAGTRIEQIDADGTVWVRESIFFDRYTVAAYLLKVTASGELKAVFRLPQIPVDDYVVHSIAINDKGEVWFMSGQPKGLAFDLIEPLPENKKREFIEPHNLSALENANCPTNTDNQVPHQLNDEPCQSRTDVFIRAIEYLYNYQCYISHAIENDPSCPGRAIPPYLVGKESQCMFSVSYSWGGFDSVNSFNEKITRIKAGNVNTAINPLPSCTAGVDCSGFISNLWGLKTKWNTGQIFEKTSPIYIKWMKTGDVFVKPGAHVILFVTQINDELSTIESVVRPGLVISSQHELGWFVQHGYFSRVAFNACEE